jgi:hypothetical protein
MLRGEVGDSSAYRGELEVVPTIRGGGGPFRKRWRRAKLVVEGKALGNFASGWDGLALCFSEAEG